MRRFHIGIAAAIVFFCGLSWAVPAKPTKKESPIVKAFRPVCDSLDSLLTVRTSVKCSLQLNAVMKRGNALDFYFTASLSDMPWTKSDIAWFKKELRQRFPAEYRSSSLGSIYTNRVEFEELPVASLSSDGEPTSSKFRTKKHKVTPLVSNPDKPSFDKGLDDMHIALWQSHGRFYDQGTQRWRWQRPCLFQTAEDLFTQSFVLPYLVPMLENAGANVLLPRERDFSTTEVIVDNDKSCDTPLRHRGKYSESGDWTKAGTGFADPQPVYEGLENPFTMGTARSASCIAYKKKGGPTATATWTPDIPRRGNYAVYVSYKTTASSTSAARYTIRHLGGESIRYVNQKMGGGTWVYLGTFEFAEGSDGCVILDNMSPEGKFDHGSTVSADAVKIGGGMGNIARRSADDTLAEASTSGLPRFAEGARYWLQWAGADSSIFSQNEQKNDYMDDFMSRGAWVSWLTAGSRVNPDYVYPPAVLGKRKSLSIGAGIPVDLSFGFHSDAGTTPNDSTIGTLTIYSLKFERSRTLPSGEDRMTSREYASLVQEQIVGDLRAGFDPQWNRRWIWDRSYSESRTTSTPAMLLELLSHQNFADMKYGLDPAFRFTVSRAVYKGMLKYLSNRYDRPYVVQPLPVKSFAAAFADSTLSRVRLSWEEPVDSLEPTAAASGYILYTRTDGGSFDNGVILDNFTKKGSEISYEVGIVPGKIYSFKVTAFNDGGESFPSEILSAGVPENGTEGTVMIVNNFDRVSAPVWFDTPQYAGFDNRTDSGVPYISDYAFTGEMYQIRRDMEWVSDDNPGFGASFDDYAGQAVGGNTFDYPYLHGKAVLRAGHPFCSSSAAAFAADTLLSRGWWAVDLICGKQVTTKIGSGSVPDRYRVFPAQLQAALADYTALGGNVLVSGSNIATDIWDKVYDVQCDSTFRAGSIKFAENVLGYSWAGSFGSRSAEVAPFGQSPLSGELPGAFSYNNRYCADRYRVEAPDGLAPAAKKPGAVGSGVFLRYKDTGIPAGIYSDKGIYRTVAIGFPIETVTDEDAVFGIINATLKYFEK